MKTEKEPKVKITVSIKKSVVEQAKKVAIQNGTSLSAIVEHKLAEVAKINRAKDNDFQKTPGIDF